MQHNIKLYLNPFLDLALERIPAKWRQKAAPFVTRLYWLVFDKFIQYRTHKDNRFEHELIVFQHWVEIAVSCWRDSQVKLPPMTLDDIKVWAAVCFLHDTAFFAKVTEADIRAAKHEAERARLQDLKLKGRIWHMEGSAQNAWSFLLKELPGEYSLDQMIRICGLISVHDSWKLGLAFPLSLDWAAVIFVEADALWPLSESGGLADLQRLHGSSYAPSLEELAKQAKTNYETQLIPYRSNFSNRERFRDKKTIIRSRGAARILRRYRRRWGF